jgi:hypothetical protein
MTLSSIGEECRRRRRKTAIPLRDGTWKYDQIVDLITKITGKKCMVSELRFSHPVFVYLLRGL